VTAAVYMRLQLQLAASTKIRLQSRMRPDTLRNISITALQNLRSLYHT